MTLRTRFVLSAMFAIGLTTAASAQQWGPSAQSHVYHDPSNPQVLTAYNTEAVAPRQQATAPAATRRVTAGKPATAARRRTTAVHRASYHAGN